jgi:hypothetical protein
LAPSKLTFLVDGWVWSVDHIPVVLKGAALAIGEYVSGIVGGYRKFVQVSSRCCTCRSCRKLCTIFLGVTAFSIGRGIWIGWKAQERWESKGIRTRIPLTSIAAYLAVTFWRWLLSPVRGIFRRFEIDGELLLYPASTAANAIVFGGLVGCCVAALFGIDWLYRHFA